MKEGRDANERDIVYNNSVRAGIYRSCWWDATLGRWERCGWLGECS